MSIYNPFIKALPIILLLATYMTAMSLDYVRPKDCNRNCMMRGEQKAGYPFVMAQDRGSTGGSPLSDWVEFTNDDYLFGARPVGYLLNILFYGSLLSVIWLFIWLIFKSYRYRQDRS